MPGLTLDPAQKKCIMSYQCYHFNIIFKLLGAMVMLLHELRFIKLLLKCFNALSCLNRKTANRWPIAKLTNGFSHQCFTLYGVPE